MSHASGPPVSVKKQNITLELKSKKLKIKIKNEKSISKLN